MERRGGKRRFRRFQAHFWRRGSDVHSVGFTTNISDTGLFVATNRPLGKGTRIRVEVGAEVKGVIFEAEVVHAFSAELGLQGMRKSGMGVRFLSVADLVAELFPEVESTAAARKDAAGEEGVFPVIFSHRDILLETFERDIKIGALFVPTLKPKEVGEHVIVELSVADGDSQPLRMTAKVVQCFEPTPSIDGLQISLIPGMGVVLSEYDIERIQKWILQ